MTTEKQTEANRRNATKSTGPKTPAGKARSAMNALKSGIDAQSAIVPGEDPANLETLKIEYHTRFYPTTPEQRMLVDTLIDAEWLLRRFRVVETQLWEYGTTTALIPRQHIALAQSFNCLSETFARLQRRVDTAQRNYRRALEDLKALQAEEQAEESREPLPEPQSLQPLTSENGFVPQTSSGSPNRGWDSNRASSSEPPVDSGIVGQNEERITA